MGDPIQLCYGAHDSHDLLLSYGFVLLPYGSNTLDKYWLDFDAISIMVRI